MQEVVIICEVDEQWSFVDNRNIHRWFWYAWEPQLKKTSIS
ncbi:IS1 family transposase [Candidatus Enterovibrio escicola]